jgi:hypothetical protein
MDTTVLATTSLAGCSWHLAPGISVQEGDDNMIATQKLHNLGQSLWLDNITRDLLESGTLKRYIAELSITGLTSNPTIFDLAIKNSASYDRAIRESLRTSRAQRTCFGRSTTARMALMGGFRLRSRHSWRAMSTRQLRRQRICSHVRRDQIYLSRSPEHEKGCQL